MWRSTISIGFRIRLALIALTATLTLSGCQLPGFLRVELPDDGPSPPVSQAAALRFAEKAFAAGQSTATTREFTLTITQEEATSFLAIGAGLMAQLQTLPQEGLSAAQAAQLPEFRDIQNLEQWQNLARRQGQDGEGRLPGTPTLLLAIEEPQVHMRGNGQIIVRGFVRVFDGRQPMRLVLAPRASGGEMTLDFVEGQFGSLPAPRLLFNLAGKGLVQGLMLVQDYASITEITVTEGVLTIRGRHDI
jgi:hypothetical protein